MKVFVLEIYGDIDGINKQDGGFLFKACFKI